MSTYSSLVLKSFKDYKLEELLSDISIWCEKNKSKDKKTWNRNEYKISNWIIPKKKIDHFKKKASKEENPPRQFLNLLYDCKEYINYFRLESGKITKRGDNSRNWRKEGSFICESLHYANSVYQTLGKTRWNNKGDTGTWKNLPFPPNRCVIITKKGTRCIKNKCKNSDMCTQHKNNFIN